MDPITNLSYVFQHTASILYRQSDQMLQERLGMGMSQFKILMMLQERPHIQQRELADGLGQTEASISRQIKLLSERGMLVVEINPYNKREHRGVPSAKGTKLLQAAQETLRGFYAPAFQHLSEKERQQFIETLTKLHVYACQTGRPFACDRPFGVQ